MNYKGIIIQMAFIDKSINKSFTGRLAKNPYKYSCVIDYIMCYYEERSTSLREALYRMLYDIEHIPCCPVCGKPLKFIGKNGKLYLSHCSNRCKKLDKQVQDKFYNTCKERYGEHNITNREKAAKTCKERYGVENPFGIDKVKTKIQDNNKKLFDMGATQEKIRQTCLEKYGVEHYLQTDESKRKRINTSFAKYGTKYPIQSYVVKTKYDWKEISNKIYIKRKTNNTLTTSSIEQQIKERLNILGIEYKYQYKSDAYPYVCDFYFPSSDLYVEIQGSWTHGGHQYTGSAYDVEIIEKWKAKHSKYYDNAIYTWTIRDVNKRKIAADNNLNYLEIFSIDLETCIKMIQDSL